MNDKYDVAIIGAGIGGLVCGCYLAKAGLKVVIVEQHDIPGGYCSSFKRKNYEFDVGGHYFSGVKDGWLGMVFNELEIRNEIKFNQFNPTDKIVMPDNVIYIRNEIDETLGEFKKTFPREKRNLSRFFKFMLDKDFVSLYMKLKRLSFKEVLDSFFKDEKIKSTLEVLLGNIGLYAENAPAVSSTLLFRNFIFDPGWYPVGGVQVFPNTLVKLIEKYKGSVILSKKVVKILMEQDKAAGVILDDGSTIRSKVVVSDADATQTFQELLDNRDTRELKQMVGLETSPSIFCVYLGLKKEFKNLIHSPANIWNFSTYNIKECYGNLDKVISKKTKQQYVVCVFPFMHDKNLYDPTMEVFIAAPFKTIKFWDNYRDFLQEKLIDKTEEIIPNLRNYIELKFNATPQTLYRYTLNKNGAAYGWASSSRLIRRPVFMNKASVKNLYLTGHWCNGGLSQGGIPLVGIMGRTAARFILDDFGLKWKYKHNLLL